MGHGCDGCKLILDGLHERLVHVYFYEVVKKCRTLYRVNTSRFLRFRYFKFKKCPTLRYLFLLKKAPPKLTMPLKFELFALYDFMGHGFYGCKLILTNFASELFTFN